MKTNFKSMRDSSEADWKIIAVETKTQMEGLPERILAHLRLLSGEYDGFPIDRLQHSLQTAALAAESGEDEEYIVCALLHDIGDTLGSYNHADVAAVILEPFVTDANYWMVKHHAVFQGYNFFHHIGMDRNMRDQFRGLEHYDRTAHFVAKYDDPAFDASKPTPNLEMFEEMVCNVFAQPRKSLYKGALGD